MVEVLWQLLASPGPAEQHRYLAWKPCHLANGHIGHASTTLSRPQGRLSRIVLPCALPFRKKTDGQVNNVFGYWFVFYIAKIEIRN